MRASSRSEEQVFAKEKRKSAGSVCCWNIRDLRIIPPKRVPHFLLWRSARSSATGSRENAAFRKKPKCPEKCDAYERKHAKRPALSRSFVSELRTVQRDQFRTSAVGKKAACLFCRRFGIKEAPPVSWVRLLVLFSSLPTTFWRLPWCKK